MIQLCSYSLLNELRVLLVHGVLHLSGLDHERNPGEHDRMAEQEQAIMVAMGWPGSGLIKAQEALGSMEEVEEEEVGMQGTSSSSPTLAQPAASSSKGAGRQVPRPAGGGAVGGSTVEAPGLGSIWQLTAAGAAGASGRSNLIRRAAVAAQQRVVNPAPSPDKTGLGSKAKNTTLDPCFSPVGPSSSLSSSSKASLKEETGLGSNPKATEATAKSTAQDKSAAPVPVASYAEPSRRQLRSSDIRLVALDMDGTLLDSKSRILKSSVKSWTAE
jgi:hypothetical protein